MIRFAKKLLFVMNIKRLLEIIFYAIKFAF